MKKKKWLGGLLNLLMPGLGSIYARKIRKGILLFIAFFIVVYSVKFMAYNFGLFLLSLFLIFIYYMYVIISGYRDVQKEKLYKPARFDKWYIYLLVFILQGIIANTIDWKTVGNFALIDFAWIPTPAMNPTLQVEDKLAFVKTKSINRYDVTLFWYPDDIETMYIKRCIGLPGDSIEIINSKVFINDKQSKEITLCYRYNVLTNGASISSKILEKYHIGEYDYYRNSPDSYVLFLTEKQAKEFSELKFVKKVELSLESKGSRDKWIYPKSENYSWNADFYGPIYVPKRGDKIQLTQSNIDLYLKCIEYENDLVEYDTYGLRIDGLLINEYQFKDDYYFMMGDNRHNSMDSRFWGFLPSSLVIGKALYLYWSKDKSRVGNKIN